ncbi:MAG: HEAT repeat domain-containing protein [Actinomycetota bacterium]
MSDSPPVKRAILSGLTGLFHGDQAADGMPEPADDAMMDPPAGPVDDRADDDSVEVTMPAPEPERQQPATPLVVARDEFAGLASRDPAERRRALDVIAARGLSDRTVPAVAGLLQDPERAIRVAALEVLAARPDAVGASVVRQALRDPSDEVRAAAVRLAAARPSRDLPDVFSLIGERQWPTAQLAALQALPHAVSEFGIGPEELDAMLDALAAMESDPGPTEHGGLAAMAASVGRARLAAALEVPGTRRLGAARLVLQDDSPASLRELAGHADDPDPDVARLGRVAADRLAVAGIDESLEEHVTKGPDDSPTAREAFEAELGPRGEMVAGLARALGDPDEAVRARGREALRAIDRATLVDWMLAALDSNDPDQVLLAAQVAEAAGVTEAAPILLARGAAATADARGPFTRALLSLGVPPEELVAMATRLDGRYRQEAVRMLWQVGGRSILPALQPLLEDASATVRVAALEVFGHSGDAQTIEVAQRVLERDSSPVVRATAISVIGRAGLDQRSASLAQALADPDPDVRATAVEVLPAGMGRHATDLLLEALSDHDERVWQAAIRHLASVPDRDRSIVWQAIERCPATRREHLVAALERSNGERLALLALDHLTSPDAAERTLAIVLAGRAGTPDCVRGIVAALQDPAPTVRRTAASALHSIHSAESIEGLSRALSDPDVEVRVETVRALSVIDDDTVLDPLITALKDPEMRVRDVAAEALVRWRSPAVARRLAVALTNPSLRRAAGEVLGRMGTSAVDPLVEILMEDDPELAATVGALLDSLVGADAFLSRLGAMDPTERLRAVEALGAMGGERGIDGLIRALSDPVESIRVRAVTLLGDADDDRAFEAVKQAFLSDPVQEVVSAAEEALRRLQGGLEAPDGQE